jgi:hypothetical protein
MTAAIAVDGLSFEDPQRAARYPSSTAEPPAATIFLR